MTKRLEVADLYPDRSAPEVADKIIEKLDDSLPMGEFIRRWELAYVDAGGKIRPPPKGKIAGK